MDNAPINKNHPFIGHKEFQYMEKNILEYLEKMINTSVWLYKPDKTNVTKSETWNETDSHNVSFLDPIEIPALIEIKPSINQNYLEESLARFEESGNMTFHVLEKTLREKNVSIEYGDYVSYQILNDLFVYYEVSNPNDKNFSNDKMFAAYGKYYKTIECTPLNQNELEFIK